MNTRTTYTFNRQRNNQGEIVNLNKPSDFISRTYENNQNDNGSVHSSYKYRRSNNPSVNGDNNQDNQNNRNQSYQNYQVNQSYQRNQNYQTFQNPNNQNYQNQNYQTFKNQNNQNEQNQNYQTFQNPNNQNYQNQNLNHSYHSHHSHHSGEDISNEDNLICPNCINSELAEMKKRREMEENRNDIPTPVFEDKYKRYNQDYINNKIAQREANQKEVEDSLNKYRNRDKEKFIRENENSINFLNNPNGNYLYDKFRNKYEEKERMINDNIDKFQNRERPEITSYFNHYVNNPNYKDNNPYGEYRKKQEDMDQYRQDLLRQIKYKENKKKMEEEEENRDAKRQYNNIQKQIEDENRMRLIREQQQKDELLRDNLKLIEEKKKRKMQEEEEEKRYKQQMDNEILRQKQYQDNLMMDKQRQRNELLQENLNNINREKNRKLREKEEDEKYKYYDSHFGNEHEKMGRCCKCHRIFPRRLLTVNQYFYKNNRV